MCATAYNRPRARPPPTPNRHPATARPPDPTAPTGAPAADLLSKILTQGQEQGLFRTNVDALDVHMIISGYSVFRMANRYTWQALFDRDMTDPATREHHRTMLADMVEAFLCAK